MIERVYEMAPGAELAAALASVDRGVLDGHDLIELMRARARQIAHEQAQLLTDMVAVLDLWRAPDTPAALAESAFESAALEIAAGLRITRRAAEGWLGLAEDALCRLPAVHQALLAGLIDVPRARVICTELTAVPDQTARGVLERVLPHAPRLTTTALGARIRKLLAAAQPEQAARAYRQALTARRVTCHPQPDGTAVITGWALPAERAAAACERIDALAKAARRAGDQRSMDQLRADTFLALLNGEHHGPAPVHRRGVVELTVPLTTLIGLANGPGELAGYGPVVADLARQVAQAQRDQATWRFSVLDAQGRLLHHGITRRRPTAAGPPPPAHRRRRRPRAHSSPPSTVVLRSPGWITAWGGVPGSSATVYGSGPRATAIPGTQPCRVTVVRNHPRLAPDHRYQRERRPVLDPHGPGWVHEYAEQPRSLGPRPLQEARERVHAPQRRRTDMEPSLSTMDRLTARHFTDRMTNNTTLVLGGVGRAAAIDGGNG